MNTLWVRLRAWLEAGHRRRTRTYNATHGAVTTRPYLSDDGWNLPPGAARIIDFEPSPQFKMPESMGIDWVPGLDYEPTPQDARPYRERELDE